MNDCATSDTYFAPRQQPVFGRRVGPTNPFVEFRKEEIEQSIVDRFERQVRSHPNRLAVKTRNHEFTYGALNQAANRLARAILAQRGRREEPVALLLENDAPMIAAILGVIKTGKLYVPLDRAYPRARIAYVLEDSGAGLVVTNDRNLSLAEELTDQAHQLINMDALDSSLSAENLGLSISPEAKLYILYTSGSTGQPKGVVDNHRNLLHQTLSYANSLHICADDRQTQLQSCCFSRSTKEILGTLLNGAALFMYDIKEEGLGILADWLIQEEITIFGSVVTTFRHLASTLTGEEKFPKLRLIYLGGEPLYKRDVELYKKHFSPDCILIHGIGTTETGTILRYSMDRETQVKGSVVPVGYVLEDMDVLLLDDARKQVGVNQVGQITVKSRYLALGYWQRPDLTRAAFLPDPEGGEARLYCTGDLGRVLPDGRMEHLGRKDFQVKIRGHRVAIAEIETALLDLAAIKEAAVVARDDRAGDKRLIAYVVPSRDPAPTTGELRRYLQQSLPEYMVPSAFLFLDALPLTPSGKVDRRRLPAPDQTRPDLESALMAPRNALECQLTEIWEGVLGIQPIGVRDNFFDLGGHSMLAAQLFTKITQVFDQSLPLVTLFQAPTVEQLANVLCKNQEGDSADWSPLVAIRSSGSRRPFFCIPGNLGNVFADLGHLARHLGSDQPFYGLQDGIGNPTQIEALATCYLDEIRPIQSVGPYLLGGICSGGVVAFEMAQQLLARGQQVPLLALVEPVPPPIPRLGSYLDLAASFFRRFTRRFGHHSRNVSQLGSVDQKAYFRLKAKLVANSWALRRYAPRPYPGRIYLFLTAESLNSAHSPQLGWRKLAAGGAEVHEIPGSHDSITGANGTKIEEAHMQALAEQLRACIDQAHSLSSVPLNSNRRAHFTPLTTRR
jgi:amino acid adenylation domain-containing protein